MFTYDGQMDRLTGHQVDIDTKADLSLHVVQTFTYDGQIDRSPGRHRCLGYLSLHVVQTFTYYGQMDR